MFCPKCATQNPEGGSFCRSCGANISLIPQALTGQLVEPEGEKSCLTGRPKGKDGDDLTQSFRNIFMGIAFVIVAIALSRSIGAGWWFWMLLPAFGMLGVGLAQFIRLKEGEKRGALKPQAPQQSFVNRAVAQQKDLTAPRTGELMAPVPSVTEGTTRHLGVEAPTRHFDAKP